MSLKERLKEKKQLKRAINTPLFGMRTKVIETVKSEVAKMKREVINEMKSIIRDITNKDFIQQILKELIGKKGVTTIKGEKGDTPKKGVDFFDGKHGKPGLPGIGITGLPGKKGDRGKDSSDLTPDELVRKINKSELFIKPSLIENLLKEIELIKGAIRKRGGASKSGGGMGNVIVETPSGTIDGSNTTFIITDTPKTNSQILTVNGQFQRLGIDYTILGKTITMLWNIPTSSDIFIWYVR